jgi:hypothetical protein
MRYKRLAAAVKKAQKEASLKIPTTAADNKIINI